MSVNEEISEPEEKTEGRRYSSFISFGNAMVIFAKKLSLLLHFYFDTVPLFLKLYFHQKAFVGFSRLQKSGNTNIFALSFKTF